MDPGLSPVMLAVLIAPFALLGIAAMTLDVSQSRRDRRDSVVTTWGELRLTTSFLLVGYGTNAPRIPLAGLTIRLTQTGSPAEGPDGHLVHVTVAGADGECVRRSQRYSQGSITGARIFEILVNQNVPAPATPVAQAPALHWAA